MIKSFSFLSFFLFKTTHLTSSGVRVNCDFTGTSSMTVDGRYHFLPVDQSFNFIPGWHKFSAFGFFKGFINEQGIFCHFCGWELIMDPVGEILNFIFLLHLVFFPYMHLCSGIDDHSFWNHGSFLKASLGP